MEQKFKDISVQLATTQRSERTFADGVYCLQLHGAVGEDEPISLRSVRETLARHDFRHLHVRITSTGGIVSEGMAIYEHLRALPVPVSSEVVGKCLSIGVAILMAGDFRFSIGEAVLLNYPTSKDRGTLPETVTASILRSYAEQLDSTDERIASLFAARTGHPVEFFLADAKTEENLSCADAIQSGLLHELAGLPQRMNPSWHDAIKTLPPGIYLPPYLRSHNYLSASRCAASLYGAHHEA